MAYQDAALGGGGILFTIIVDVVIATVLYIIFGLLCLRITPFVVSKKRKLFGKFLARERLHEEEVQRILNENNETNYLVELEEKGYTWPQNRFARYWKTRLLFFLEITKSLFVPSAHSRDIKRSTNYYGRDVATYFFFERLLIWSFIIMTVLGLAVLLPVHLTGTLPPNYRNSKVIDPGLTYTAVEMIETSPVRTSATIILSFFFLVIVAGFCIFFFCLHPLVRDFNFAQHDEKPTIVRGLERFQPMINLRNRLVLEEHLYGPQQKLPLLLCPYTLEIQGMTRELVSQAAFTEMIRKCMAKESKYGSSVDDILHQVLVLDLLERVELQRELQKVENQLDHAEYVWEQKSSEGKEERPKKSLLCTKYQDHFRFKTKVDAIEYYKTLKADIEHEIFKWDTALNRVLRYGGSYTNISLGTIAVDQQTRELIEIGAISPSDIKVEDKPISRLEGIKNKFLLKGGQEKQYKIQGSGYGFIVFRNLNALRDFERNYRNYKLDIEDALEMQDREMNNNVDERLNGIQQLTNIGNRVMTMAVMRVNRISFEPEDVLWDNLFKLTHLSRAVPYVRKTIAGVLIVLLLIFLSTPIAFASTVQILLNGGVFPGININTTNVLSGALGALVFQYMPTLLLLIASLLIPLIIIALTMFEKNKSRGQIQRLILERIYVYLILSTLVLPVFVQASMSGLASGFVNGGVTAAFGNMFLPYGGAFFVNYVLQRAFISVILNMVMIGVVIKYLIKAAFTSKWWKKLHMYRHITPVEHLDAAEPPDPNLEMNYANIISLMGIGLVLGVFTPVVLPCCLLFFLGNYYVDRFTISMVYGQRRQVYAVNGKPLIGAAAYGIRSDYVTHRKNVQTVVKLVLANMIIFTVFLALFFGSKISVNLRFIAHTIIAAAFAAVCVFAAIFTTVFSRIYLNRNKRLDMKNSYVKPTKENVGNGYAPPPPAELGSKEKTGVGGSASRIGISASGVI